MTSDDRHMLVVATDALFFLPPVVAREAEEPLQHLRPAWLAVSVARSFPALDTFKLVVLDVRLERHLYGAGGHSDLPSARVPPKRSSMIKRALCAGDRAGLPCLLSVSRSRISVKTPLGTATV